MSINHIVNSPAELDGYFKALSVNTLTLDGTPFVPTPAPLPVRQFTTTYTVSSAFSILK